MIAVHALQPLLLTLVWGNARHSCHAWGIHGMPGGLGVHAGHPRGETRGVEPPMVGVGHLGVGNHVHAETIAIHGWVGILVSSVVGVHVGDVMRCGGVGVPHGGLVGVQVIRHGGCLVAVLLLVMEGLCCVTVMTLRNGFPL